MKSPGYLHIDTNMKTLMQFALGLSALLAISTNLAPGAEAVHVKCNWNDNKSLSEFLSCVSKNRVKRNTRADPCTSFVSINQPQRRVGNIITQLSSSTLCDRTLKRRWYRFEGPGGGAMPTECVPEFHCGTHAPIWLNGTHPRNNDTKSMEACVSLAGNCCQYRWNISVANCGDFYAYQLIDTPGCYMAYCAGNESPCLPRESSPTGFSPGCSENFPRLDGSANVTVVKEGHQVAFYCDYKGVIHASSIIDVEWFAEGDSHGERPVYTDRILDNRKRSVLNESQWNGKMGSTIYCRIRARWSNGIGAPSPAVISNRYFAGIKILTPVVEVSEKEKEAHIQIQSTIPVVCLPQFEHVCDVTVGFAHDPNPGGKFCVDGQVRQVVFGDCNVNITSTNWQQVHNIPVKAVRDFYGDGTKTMRVEFKPIHSTISSLWNKYQPPNVEVTVKDSPVSMCSTTGEPHYSTFDGLFYDLHLEGEFVLYKHASLPIQINTRLERIAGTANCGVAVMAADDVIVVDHCTRHTRLQASGPSFPDGWRALHRHALEQGDSFVEGFKIYEYDDGMRYSVHLPTGAYIDIQLIMSRYMNIFLHASSDDWNATRGLCGTFDNDISNDFALKDGVNHITARNGSACPSRDGGNDVCKFGETWRVPRERSLFGSVVTTDFTEHNFKSSHRFCKCEASGGNSRVACNYQNDVDNCERKKMMLNGIDKTDGFKIINIVPGSPARRRRRSVELDEANDDYFNSEFVYDETFKGTVPTWPTPSGVTETQARDYCIDVIMRSETGRVCQQVVQEQLITIIDECVVDIKITDDFTWALSALNKLSAVCVNQIHQKAEYWERPAPNGEEVPGPSDGQLLLGSVCPGGCSLRGECLEGKCHCQNGYGGDDCSTDLLAAPKIAYISAGGMCDVRIRPCQSIKVYGTGFRRREHLTCHFRTHSDEIIQTDARFETFEEITCRLPEHDVTPMNPDVQRGSPSEAFGLAISQLGALSEEKMVLIYDSTCQMCVYNVSHYECVQKEDTCLVNGFCFEHGEKHPEDCCRLCDPSRSNDTLVGLKSNGAPMWLPSQTSFNAYIGEPWQLDVQASDPEGCQVMYEATPVDRNSFYLDVTSSGVSAELDSQETGTYAFNVTAQDECGGSVTQQYSVYLMPSRSSTTTASSNPHPGTANTGVPRVFSVTSSSLGFMVMTWFMFSF